MIGQLIIAGLVLGIVSCLHCVGMCGPLALALPVHHLTKPGQVIAMLLYHAGRIMTYTLLGLLFGLAGRSIYLAGFQQYFSIALGCIVLLFSLSWFMNTHKPVAWLQPFYHLVQQLMHQFLRSRQTGSFWWLGMANGLLPCGMVYLAIAGAVSTTQTSHGVIFMFFFGTGTLPAMLALSLFKQRITLAWRLQLQKLVPWCITGMALLLILRGLNLGIPYISPLMPNAPQQAASCH
jgi:sulfite exporter TauE/SafE